jgi:hypothetical protein
MGWWPITVLAIAWLGATDANAAPLPALPIAITVTSGTPAAAKPITVSWKLVNTSTALLTGSIVYYLNNVNLTPLDLPNDKSITKGSTLSGTFTFNPVPGINQLTVSLLDTVHAVDAGSTPKLTDLAPGQVPKPEQPTAPPASPVNLVASGTVPINASPTLPTLANGLTDTYRQQLMADYAPLLLYSNDGGEEQYAPIDVIAFVQGSSLTGDLTLPNSTLANATAVLQSNGTIAATQPGLPIGRFIAPSASVEKGADWNTVMQRAAAASSDPSHQTHEVGLYGHVTLLDLNHFQSDADPNLPALFAARYNCTATQTSAGICPAHGPAQVIKIEYWQFFGYSYDFSPSASAAMAAALVGSALGGIEGLISAGASANDIIQGKVNHSGDWCTVQVYVDAAWWASARPDLGILAVYHYLHGNQVGFDMGAVTGAPASITVPARAQNATGSTYSAQEYHGPNFGSSVQFSINPFGSVWLPPGGPDQATEKAHAQNSVLQLATLPVTQTTTTAKASYQHPVVYVEYGGHEFWPSTSWSYYGASKHNGTGQYSYFASYPVDLTPDTKTATATVAGRSIPLLQPPPTDVTLVTDFAGYWGAKGGGGPPQGPPLHTQWYWDPRTTPADLLSQIETKQLADGKPWAQRTF